jgi:serine/threonine protein kinase
MHDKKQFCLPSFKLPKTFQTATHINLRIFFFFLRVCEMSIELQSRSRIMQGRVVRDLSSVVDGVSAYALVESLEEWRHGGFGIVSKVQRLSDRKPFIAKFIPLNLVNDDRNRSVIREIDNMERVTNIFACVKLEEHFLQDDFVSDLIEEEYHGNPVGVRPSGLAMVLIEEYMEGGDIGSLIARGVFSTNVKLACVVFLQVIVGLHQIHQLNMIHRDIGAGNILIDATNRVVKIADFGFSNSYDGETRRLDAVQTQLGTISYRPPEVWMKERYGAPADIFALGVLMYEAIGQAWAFGEYDEANIKELEKRLWPWNVATRWCRSWWHKCCSKILHRGPRRVTYFEPQSCEMRLRI